MNKIELLAPAGDLEKLKAAVLYGADAVYMGGTSYSLRAKAKNFGLDEMREAIKFAHQHNVKVYVTINIFAHDEDFYGMAEYFKTLMELEVDAFIISDPGVFSLAREIVPSMEIHISTQANNTNYRSAVFWRNLGAKRIIAARELTLKELKHISQNIGDCELEAFVHGAMCMSISGRCLMSNFINARDANRGECSQPCRFEYSLCEKSSGEVYTAEEDSRGTYIFNSKDLCMIAHIPELIDAGITSFKIEGRMKTSFYVATITKAYRNAIDDYLTDKDLYKSKIQDYIDEVRKVSHRDYYTGFFFGRENNGQIYSTSSYIQGSDFVAIVLDYDKANGIATIEQRNRFFVGEQLEILKSSEDNDILTIEKMLDDEGNEVEVAPHPKQILRVKIDKEVKSYDMLRRVKSK